MYKATVNGSNYEIVRSADGHLVNGESITLDVVRVRDKYFHILMGGKSYRAEVVRADHGSKSFTLKINGALHVVSVKNQFDLLLEKMGMKAADTSRVNLIKAPMPGLIVDLKVKEGDTVKKGDALLILEAMKMENVIKSPGDAVVKSIKVKKGSSVEKNAVLIEF